MNRDEKENTAIYKVVVNHEEQYSIWPADRENPTGWGGVRLTVWPISRKCGKIYVRSV